MATIRSGWIRQSTRPDDSLGSVAAVLRSFHKLELAETGADCLLCTSYPTLEQVKVELAAERAREAKEQRAAERHRAEARKAHQLAKRAAHRAKQRAARREERQRTRRAREQEAAERDAARDRVTPLEVEPVAAPAPAVDVDADVLASLDAKADARNAPNDIATEVDAAADADAHDPDEVTPTSGPRRSGDPPE